jgi:hypothetical protein
MRAVRDAAPYTLGVEKGTGKLRQRPVSGYYSMVNFFTYIQLSWPVFLFMEDSN